MVSQNSELKNAFRWTTRTLPSKYKTSSVSYYQAIEVALIGGLMCGAGIFFMQQAMIPAGSTGIQHWIISILAGIVMVFAQLQVYKRSLR
jgi:hypothetical protein